MGVRRKRYVEYGLRVSIPLTLGVPRPRDSRPLTAGLLLPHCVTGEEIAGLPHASAVGSPVVPASVLATTAIDNVIAYLDVDPETVPADRAVSGFHLDATVDDLDEVLQLRPAAPLTVFLAGEPDAEELRTVAAAGHSLGIDAAASPAAISDFLAVLAHSDVGFVARADGPKQVLEMLSATVAALRGNDVRTALSSPDIDALIRLNDDAAAAVRTILRGIVVTSVTPVLDFLAGFQANPT